MPLLAPLGDLVGNRQVTVLGLPVWRWLQPYYLSDISFADGHAGRVPVDFRNWLKVGASLLGLLFIMSSVVVIGAQMMGYRGPKCG